MSETVDPTLLSTQLLGLDREMRLLRSQLDTLMPRVAATDTRVAALEQSFHDLVGEVSRGFGQNEQRFGRLERRLDAVDAGLTELRGELAESTSRIMQAIKGEA
jgi:uncharacterized protein involved in exopolysaccharide biosynthesis